MRHTTLAVVTAALAVVGCNRREDAAAQADSALMVSALMFGLQQTDTVHNRTCRTSDGLHVVDTGQAPCDRNPIPVMHLVAYRPDSAGACIWVEAVLPPGTRFVDGGPVGYPVSRAGTLRTADLQRQYCNRMARPAPSP